MKARGLIERVTIEATAGAVDDRLSCVPAVRRRFRAVLERWGVQDDDLHDALCVLSELVANAARHSPPGRHHASVHLSPDGDRLVITVHDLSRAMPYVPATATNPDAESGRGVLLVADLSENWGAVPTAGGKKVWAELKLRQSVSPRLPGYVNEHATQRALRRAHVIDALRAPRLCAVPKRRVVA